MSAPPVVHTVETQVPVAPRARTRSASRARSAPSRCSGAPITAFGGLDNVTKAIVASVAVVAILLLLLRREQIAARTKAILRVLSHDPAGARLVRTHAYSAMGVVRRGGVILAALYGCGTLACGNLLWVGALLAIGLIFPAAARAGWRAKEQADWNAANKGDRSRPTPAKSRWRKMKIRRTFAAMMAISATKARAGCAAAPMPRQWFTARSKADLMVEKDTDKQSREVKGHNAVYKALCS